MLPHNPQRLQHRAGELWQLVEEQNAEVGERGRARIPPPTIATWEPEW